MVQKTNSIHGCLCAKKIGQYLRLWLVLTTLTLGLCLLSAASASGVKAQGQPQMFEFFNDDFSSESSKEKWWPFSGHYLWRIDDGKLAANYYTTTQWTGNEARYPWWDSMVPNIEVSYQIWSPTGEDLLIPFRYQSYLQGTDQVRVTPDFIYVEQYDGNLLTRLEVLLHPTAPNLRQPNQVRFGYNDNHHWFVLNDQVIFDDLNLQTSVTANSLLLKAEPTEGRSGVTYYDNIVATTTLLPAVELELTALKQTELNDEYDSASSWTDHPSFAHWGCLVTSIVMVMNYHGLTTMPDGSEVSLASVNNWLIHQPDGYIGHGLVNWAAITRLSKQMSSLYGTPALEYAIHSDYYSAAFDAIQRHHPVIFQVPGHFVAGYGLSSTTEYLIPTWKHTFLIHDPYYSYPSLNYYGDDVISTRLLTPSYTDLSSIIIVGPRGVPVTLTDQAGDKVAQATVVEEWINAPADTPAFDRLREKHRVIYAQKPPEGTYKVTIPPWYPYNQTIEIWAYDQQAEVIETHQIRIQDHEQVVILKINYQDEPDPILTTLQTIYTDHAIPVAMYQQLHNLFTKAEMASISSQQLQTQVRLLFQVFGFRMSQTAQEATLNWCHQVSARLDATNPPAQPAD